MKKLFISSLVTVFVLSGCFLFGGAPEADPKEVLGEAIDNLLEIDSLTYDAVMSSHVTFEDEETSFDLNANGGLDVSDMENVVFSMRAIAEGTGGDYDGEKFDGEVMLGDGKFYFVVHEVTTLGGLIPSEVTDAFLAKWYFMDLPEETKKSLSEFSFSNEENMTEDQKKMKALINDTDFFKDIVYLRSEKGRYIYGAFLDKDAFVNFSLESAMINGVVYTEAEIKELEDSMDMFELDLELGVDSGDMILSMISGQFTSELPDEGFKEGSASFEIYFEDINDPFEIDVPEDAEMFDSMMLFGAAMMMGGETELLSAPPGALTVPDSDVYGAESGVVR